MLLIFLPHLLVILQDLIMSWFEFLEPSYFPSRVLPAYLFKFHGKVFLDILRHEEWPNTASHNNSSEEPMGRVRKRRNTGKLTLNCYQGIITISVFLSKFILAHQTTFHLSSSINFRPKFLPGEYFKILLHFPHLDLLWNIFTIANIGCSPLLTLHSDSYRVIHGHARTTKRCERGRQGDCPMHEG